MMRKPIRTPLTDEQKKDADRLRAIFKKRAAEAKAGGGGFTQTDLGEACGWSSPQSMVSQFMTGKVALSLDAVMKLARALEVDPSEISPSLASGILLVEEGSPVLSKKKLAVYVQAEESGTLELMESSGVFEGRDISRPIINTGSPPSWAVTNLDPDIFRSSPCPTAVATLTSAVIDATRSMTMSENDVYELAESIRTRRRSAHHDSGSGRHRH